ncbi:hypothetical protein VNI00_010025 [Paramarasmius palmivorus]|uniref:Uncharacterized protein n=1 Tax=Paramarasmius palmivorus TaxID=297713 RepID=A0AAW0CQ58_9AGAR
MITAFGKAVEESLGALQESKAGVAPYSQSTLFLGATATEIQWQQSSSVISISSVFGPNGPESVTRPPVDIVLISSDNIVFYADESTLLNVSTNSFNGRLPLRTQEKPKRILFLSDIISYELQVFLQSIYDVSSDCIPELDVLMRGIDLLPKYGIQPKSLVLPRTPVFDYVLSYAPTKPLEIYAFAASHDIYALAIQAPSYLLGIDLTADVNMEMVEKMGGKYLLKLFILHLRRKEVLKGLLITVPDLHGPTEYCGYEEQKQLKAQWTFGSWDGWRGFFTQVRAPLPPPAFISNNLSDISTTQIQETILEATRFITCQECLKKRDARLYAILRDWSTASRTI